LATGSLIGKSSPAPFDCAALPKASTAGNRLTQKTGNPNAARNGCVLKKIKRESGDNQATIKQ